MFPIIEGGRDSPACPGGKEEGCTSGVGAKEDRGRTGSEWKDARGIVPA